MKFYGMKICTPLVLFGSRLLQAQMLCSRERIEHLLSSSYSSFTIIMWTEEHRSRKKEREGLVKVWATRKKTRESVRLNSFELLWRLFFRTLCQSISRKPVYFFYPSSLLLLLLLRTNCHRLLFFSLHHSAPSNNTWSDRQRAILPEGKYFLSSHQLSFFLSLYPNGKMRKSGPKLVQDIESQDSTRDLLRPAHTNHLKPSLVWFPAEHLYQKGTPIRFRQAIYE